MFDSAAGLKWIKDTPLYMVWMVGLARKETKYTKGLSRKKCLETNIEEACDLIKSKKMTLTIVGNLLVGIIRIFDKKTFFMLQDSRAFKEHCDNVTKACTSLARPNEVTLPEPMFDIDFTSVQDINLSSICLGSPEDYLIITDAPKAGSICSSPDGLFVADEKDITLPDNQVVPETSFLERSLADLEGECFGDEGSSFFSQDNHTGHVSPGSGRQDHSNNSSRDQVLIFDEDGESFSFVNGHQDNSIEDGRVPDQEPPLQLFNSPFIQDSTRPPPRSPRSSPSSFTLAHFSPEGHINRFKRRKTAKKRVFDSELSLPEGMSGSIAEDLPVEFLTRPGIEVTEKRAKAKDLVQLETALFIKDCSDILSGFYKSLLSRARDHPLNHTVSPISLTQISATSTSRGSNAEFSDLNSGIEIERQRQLSTNDHSSFREQSGQTSNLLGSQLGSSTMSGSSIQGTSLARERPMPTDNVGPRVLSPIVDVEDEDYSNAGIDGDFDHSSMDCIPPFNESASLNVSSTLTFARTLDEALQEQDVVEFKELLPDVPVSRKTAAVSFFKLLGSLSKTNHFNVQQNEPYGPILITKRS